MGGAMLMEIPWWVFDAAIVAMLVGGGWFALWAMARAHDGAWGWGVAAAVVLVAWVTIFYGSFVAPRWLTVREHSVVLREGVPSRSPLPDDLHTLRVAVVSDYHVGPYKGARFMRRVVHRVNALNVDAVFSPGDFITRRTREVEQLAPLADYAVPVYAVTGNHEYQDADADAVVARLREFGLKVLRNESTTLRTEDGGSLTIVGIDDIWFTPDPPAAYAGVDKNALVVVLAHNPDFILDPYAPRADLVISGHTHGGQIRLPFVGSVPPLPTRLGRSYDRGWFKLDTGRRLFISEGVGETGPRARLFSRPTIDVMTIRF